jgi:hypothetical protein
MTDNQTKANNYLCSIREVEKQIKSREDELEALRYKASGAGAIRYDKDQVQTSPDDYLSLAVMDIVEIEKQIKEDQESIERKKGEAYRITRSLPEPNHRAFIEWYYLNGISMIDTANRMNMSERNTYYLRDESLEAFGEKI